MEQQQDKKEALKELLKTVAENVESVEKITIVLTPRKTLQGTGTEKPE